MSTPPSSIAAEVGSCVPQIGERQQWCCASGCGPCKVKAAPFVWHEVSDLEGNILQQDSVLQDVSACCGAELMLWDEDKQDFVDFALLPRPVSPKLEVARDRCHADRDGDCVHAQCPQLSDGEPHASGRHCPLDINDADDSWLDDDEECERCHGDGRDPWNDFLLPCPLCQGEQN